MGNSNRRGLPLLAALGLVSLAPGIAAASTAPSSGPSTTCKSITQLHRGTKIVLIRNVRFVDGKRRISVRRRRVTYAKTVHRSVCMTTNLDPTFSQAGNDPLDVTFTASVDASGFTGAVLPQGVLSLYVNGALACATDVEGTTNSMNCKTELTSTGSQTLITQYLSGTNSASQTETVTVPAFTTTTSISAQASSSAITFSAETTDQNGNVLSDTTVGSNGLINGSITISVSSTGLKVAPSSFPIPLGETCSLTPTEVSGDWLLQGSIASPSAAGCDDTQYTSYIPGNPVTISAAFAKNGYAPSTGSFVWSPGS